MALALGLLGMLASGGLAGYVVLSEPGSASPGSGADGAAAAPSAAAPSAASPGASAAGTGTGTVSAAASPGPSSPDSYPSSGPGTYTYASGRGPVLGIAGTLRRFRVAVEKTVPVGATDFAAEVEATLGDPRSWIGGKNVRLQRVAPGETFDFTIYLATANTAGKLCLAGGLDVRVNGEPYTSCRVGSRVVINLTRYMESVPGYGAPLATYRQYVINHEVGHALGHGHELCPKKGEFAPVMQQQTLYMQGCKANPWPYLDGKRYAGPAGHL